MSATHTISKPTWFDLILILLLVCIWASAFQAIKISVEEVTPVWLAFSRASLGLLFLLPYGLYIGLKRPASITQLLLLPAISLLNIVFPFILISWAELKITSAEASLMMGAGPFLALILSHIFTHDEKLNIHKIIGVTLGMAAILLLFGREAIESGLGNLSGLIAAFVASICYVTSGLLVRKINGLGAVDITVWTLGFGFIFLGLIVVLAGIQSPQQISNLTILSLIYLGLFPTGIGYLLRYYLIRKIGYSYVAMGVNLIAPIGVLLGALLLSEPVTTNMIISLSLILLGLFIARKGV